ncbi:alpha/beta hydrolase [Cellulomonas hominis]|uniref:alpha/beta fold hydrolase n=1 Tax=Cellulomonas hominis TaxID=156981 RepID=UPI001C0FC60B|nr:alpha/beta hydrolase [Cellulomonas hominis]MBU5422168.1 alpha/beta hydrolase [Cellulomonas hominis]
MPLVALTHLGANLDGWDPRVVDGLAESRQVLAIGYRGVGDHTERVRDSIEAMADDAIAAIGALGHDRVDLFGLSMGGMVAQAVTARAPGLVDRLLLAGSGPAGGPGLTGMTRRMLTTTARAAVTLHDPRELLFFTRTPAGRRAAKQYLARLEERTADREPRVRPSVLRAQLAAVHRWGQAARLDHAVHTGPTLIVHGDRDLLVPSTNATALAGHLPTAQLVVYPDSGHGVVFQNHAAFVAAADGFLRR